MRIDPRECKNCGCQPETHPIPACKKFVSPMTNNPSAEEIAKWFFQVDDPQQNECEKLIKQAEQVSYERGRQELKQQLTEAVDAYAKAVTERDKAMVINIASENKWHRAGYYDGLEAAARVADDIPHPNDEKFPLAEMIAERIRALKEKKG